jgi:hypothetical protein
MPHVMPGNTPGGVLPKIIHKYKRRRIFYNQFCPSPDGYRIALFLAAFRRAGIIGGPYSGWGVYSKRRGLYAGINHGG